MLSAVGSRAITLVIFGVDPIDPVTYGLTSLVPCVSAIVASGVPAFRAARASTAGVLRAE